MILPWRGLAALLACAAALPLAAQPASGPTRCHLVPQPTTRLSADTLPTGQQVAFLGGGVLLECPARGISLRSDSAERYPDRDFLVGHVVYDEPRFHVTSDYMTHYPTDERIVAVQNVDARLPSGSTLVGPMAEYRRAVAKIRPRRQMIARYRPTITIVEKDSAGKQPKPMTVVADTVFMDGDSLIYANGQVIITRPRRLSTGSMPTPPAEVGKRLSRLSSRLSPITKTFPSGTATGSNVSASPFTT